MNRHRPHVLLICMLCAWAYLAEPSLCAPVGIPSNFLGADTVGVVRLEVEQIDAPGLRDWALKTLRDAKVDPQVVEGFAEQVRGMVAKSENWRQNLKRAGVTKVYLVVRQPILLKLPFVVVPLEKGSDPEAVAAQLEAEQIISGKAATPSTEPANEHERQLLAKAARAQTFRAQRIGDVVVYANELTLDELRGGGPTTKSASAAGALAAAAQRSAGVQVCLLPDAVRFLRDLPKEQDSKADDPLEKAISKVQWGRLDLQVGKRPTAMITLYCAPGSTELVKRAFEDALGSLVPDSKWSAVLKSLHVVAGSNHVDLQLTSEDLGRLLVSWFKEPPSTQPTTAATTRKAPR